MKGIRILVIGMVLAASCLAARAEDESTTPTEAVCHDLLTSAPKLNTIGVQQLVNMYFIAHRCEAYPSQEATAKKFLGAISTEISTRYHHYLERHNQMHSFLDEDQKGKR